MITRMVIAWTPVYSIFYRPDPALDGSGPSRDLLPLGIIKYASRTRIAFPCLSMAFWTDTWGNHGAFGFKTTRSALQLKDHHSIRMKGGGLIRRKLSFRPEPLHAYRHINLLGVVVYNLRGLNSNDTSQRRYQPGRARLLVNSNHGFYRRFDDSGLRMAIFDNLNAVKTSHFVGTRGIMSH